MNILDLFVLLVAAIIATLAHTPLGYTIIGTLLVLIVLRFLRGERIAVATSPAPPNP